MGQVKTVLRARPHIHGSLEELELEDQRRREAFSSSTKEFAAEFGVKLLITSSLGFSGRVVTGYLADSYSDEPHPGFRKDSKKPLWRVPAKKTPEGKAWAKRFSEAALKLPRDPGLPEYADGPGFFGIYTVTRIGDHYFATLGFEVGERSLAAVDTERWEKVKLSTYFAAVEDAEESQKVKA